MTLDVRWVFGLARSGSSITAYAAAAPWNLPVADEILGPWDRTGKPYNYPPAQAELVELFKQTNASLTPEVADRTRALLRQIADAKGADRIISKHPHLRFTPEEFHEQFPDDRGIWVIRNPLRRLASIHSRGWTSIVRPNHDLDFFREYAERWLALPDDRTLIFENLRRDPHAYFAKLYRAWEWNASQADIAKAVAYQQSNYHGKSGDIEPDHSPQTTRSDASKAVPEEAVYLYLNDPFMRRLFKKLGWSRRPGDYYPKPPTPLERLKNKLIPDRSEP
ncbi:MAG TPA: hypothetical protein ENJ00_02790 [Phycisphaerales bacterium]|nr:hypothetical protein [Phycisphaerales bacterium]